ncbi:MAG: hypothetical protein GEU28_13080 [Dehalococcoidia bacterium]|nr:hypothetical protein [Dehalococcoidia bacterium]
MSRTYTTLLWVFHMVGAPALTLLLAVVTIPLLLSNLEAGLVLLLLPGILTLTPLIGLVHPGEATRDSYFQALIFAALRLALPVAIFAVWFELLDESARETDAAILAVLAFSALASFIAWLWSMDFGLAVYQHVDTAVPRVSAKRVEISPGLERDQRREMLRARERHGRIGRALDATRVPSSRSSVSEPRAEAAMDTANGKANGRKRLLTRLSRVASTPGATPVSGQPRPAGPQESPPEPGEVADGSAQDSRPDVFTGRGDA